MSHLIECLVAFIVIRRCLKPLDTSLSEAYDFIKLEELKKPPKKKVLSPKEEQELFWKECREDWRQNELNP